MLLKLLIIFTFFAILFSLGSALRALIKSRTNPASSQRMVKALTVRISLSLVLFGFIILSYFLGWITPNHWAFMH
ncbi:MAG: twin transmembrane helix small protein [Legionellales bacterium]|nr:twin transmembrane helix small protein [Legionellales bacterium]